MNVFLVRIPRGLTVEGHVAEPARVGPGVGVGVDVLSQVVAGGETFTTVRTTERLLIVGRVEVHHVISGRKKSAMIMLPGYASLAVKLFLP